MKLLDYVVKGVPELYKGIRVVMVGDSEGYIRTGHKPGEEAIIVGFREPFEKGSTDYIVLVSNSSAEGWVKPSNTKVVQNRDKINESYDKDSIQ